MQTSEFSLHIFVNIATGRVNARWELFKSNIISDTRMPYASIDWGGHSSGKCHCDKFGSASSFNVLHIPTMRMRCFSVVSLFVSTNVSELNRCSENFKLRFWARNFRHYWLSGQKKTMSVERICSRFFFKVESQTHQWNMLVHKYSIHIRMHCHGIVILRSALLLNIRKLPCKQSQWKCYFFFKFINAKRRMIIIIIIG